MMFILNKICLPLFLLSFIFPDTANCQSKEQHYSKKGFELTIIAMDSNFSPLQLNRLSDIFFQTYPKLVKDFNKKSPKQISITMIPLTMVWRMPTMEKS